MAKNFSGGYHPPVKVIFLHCEAKGPSVLNVFVGPIAHLVEHRADNAGVSGSSPDGPTILEADGYYPNIYGAVAQLGEHLLCKQGVRSSILLSSTSLHFKIIRLRHFS